MRALFLPSSGLMTFLIAVSGVAWTIVYIAAVRIGFTHRCSV
jgi:hypothetical protein